MIYLFIFINFVAAGRLRIRVEALGKELENQRKTMTHHYDSSLLLIINMTNYEIEKD